MLLQELECFNKLCSRMSNSLLSLIKAAYGGVRMTDHLEEVSESLLNGFISNFWKSVAPPDTEKRLGSWMAHFSCWLEQSLAWIQEGTLTVVWLGGLHSPDSYLIALVQMTFRAMLWPFDQWAFHNQLRNERQALRPPMVTTILVDFT